VSARAVELRPTIDRRWLDRAAGEDPVVHAYALWDLLQAPDRVRFVSVVDGGTTAGYLLLWLGHPAGTIVHWVGAERFAPMLAGALPPRPFVAVVPPAAREATERARGPGREVELRVMVRAPGASPISPEALGAVRRLARSDAAALSAWAARQTEAGAAEYVLLDPGAVPVWGGFENGRLVGVARAAVRLPRVWIVGGVFVEPSARGQGWGRRVVGAVASAAEADGALAALYVREDRAAAVRLYESLGFGRGATRWWIDLGTGIEP
jgi:GNAT superfamily N-acetyltransferase